MEDTVDTARGITAAPPIGAIPEQRTAARSPGDGPTPAVTRCWRCGHDREAHEHYRPGTDCSACDCARYRRGRRRR